MTQHSAATSRNKNAKAQPAKFAKNAKLAKTDEHKKLSKEVDSLLTKQQVQKSKVREQHLEGLLERAMSEIEKLRSSKFSISGGVKKPVARPDKSKYLMAMGDTHGCFVEQAAVTAALNDAAALQPEIIVLLGDHLDCGGFLAQHMTLGYVAEAEYAFQDDVNAANQFLDAVRAACPNAEIIYIEGNHEIRIERWIMTQRMRNKKDAKYLRDMFSPNTVLELEKRGIRFIARGQMYDGLSVPGSIKIGKCYFTHGSYCGEQATKKHLQRFGGNVVFGHVHIEDTYTTRTVTEPRTGAWTPGCLCHRQPLYMHTNPTSWVHGYHLQVIQPDGAFLPMNVPIIDGISYAAPLFANML